MTPDEVQLAHNAVTALAAMYGRSVVDLHARCAALEQQLAAKEVQLGEWRGSRPAQAEAARGDEREYALRVLVAAARAWAAWSASTADVAEAPQEQALRAAVQQLVEG